MTEEYNLLLKTNVTNCSTQCASESFSFSLTGLVLKSQILVQVQLCRGQQIRRGVRHRVRVHLHSPVKVIRVHVHRALEVVVVPHGVRMWGGVAVVGARSAVGGRR